MIKINLATRKQAAGTTEIKDVKTALTRMDVDSLKALPLRRLGVLAVTLFAVSYVLDAYKEEELAKARAAFTKVQAEQTRLKAELASTKGFEAMKKALDADEEMIRAKIDTVQKLIADRQTPPKLLSALSSTIPGEVWLVDFKLDGEDVKFNGMSLGFNQISDFMKTLNENAYFMDVRLVATQQAQDETGTNVAKFELAAKRRKQ